MTLPEILQYANLLLVPAMAYIVKLENRIGRLEVLLGAMSENLSGHMRREEVLMDRLTERRQLPRDAQ